MISPNSLVSTPLRPREPPLQWSARLTSSEVTNAYLRDNGVESVYSDGSLTHLRHPTNLSVSAGRPSSVGMLPNHQRPHRSAQNSASQGLQRQPTAFVGPDTVTPLPPTQQYLLMAPHVDAALLQGQNSSPHSSGGSRHHRSTQSQSQGLQSQPSEMSHSSFCTPLLFT